MSGFSGGIPYAEGTWTPVFTFATPGNLVVAYSVQNGVYTRIGRVVHANFFIALSTFTHTTASGNAQVTGLPFTSANVSNQNAYGPCFWGGITKANYTNVAARLVANSNVIDFGISGSGQTPTTVQSGDTPTGGALVLTGTLSLVV
jgi:hypothetical protein